MNSPTWLAIGSEEIVRLRATLLVVLIAAGCHGQPKDETGKPTDGNAARAAPSEEEIVPVELGRRPPNTRMTSANMPFFDTVTYCLLTTRKTDTKVKGPQYEACIELQDATRRVIGQAIDANEFEEDNIVRCAKASRTAYQGMWFCMNGKPNPE